MNEEKGRWGPFESEFTIEYTTEFTIETVCQDLKWKCTVHDMLERKNSLDKIASLKRFEVDIGNKMKVCPMKLAAFSISS